MPKLSEHFLSRKPSSIRAAQILFARRENPPKDVNVSIGNISLPMHPKMIERMQNIMAKGSPFCGGVVKYCATVGTKEANDAFLNIIASSGFETHGLYSQITDGGSMAMELVMLGVLGGAGKDEDPLLMFDPAYTNYGSFASRLGRKTVSIKRDLLEDGTFSLPDIKEIEALIIKEKPTAMLVIPYDNPTGQMFSRSQMVALARLCVKHDLWMISDEAYRELYYTDGKVVSIWGITNNEVADIEGRRISIETTSKVWNACGLRIGALVTDNFELHQKAVAENTASLCANVIGQYIFGAMAYEKKEVLHDWYNMQRTYYKAIATNLVEGFNKEMPDVIISKPDASVYSVIDVRNVVDCNFDAQDFVSYCAKEGSVDINGVAHTLLVAPIADFYDKKETCGRTMMRISYVENPEEMQKIPYLFKHLLNDYLDK